MEDEEVVIKRVNLFKKGDGIIAVAFDYDETIIEGLRVIPGRRWSPSEKKWYFPDLPDTRREIERIFAGFTVIDIGPELFDGLLKEMRSRKYSRKTISSYLYYNRDFLEFCGKSCPTGDIAPSLSWSVTNSSMT